MNKQPKIKITNHLSTDTEVIITSPFDWWPQTIKTEETLELELLEGINYNIIINKRENDNQRSNYTNAIEYTGIPDSKRKYENQRQRNCRKTRTNASKLQQTNNGSNNAENTNLDENNTDAQKLLW